MVPARYVFQRIPALDWCEATMRPRHPDDNSVYTRSRRKPEAVLLTMVLAYPNNCQQFLDLHGRMLGIKARDVGLITTRYDRRPSPPCIASDQDVQESQAYCRGRRPAGAHPQQTGPQGLRRGAHVSRDL